VAGWQCHKQLWLRVHEMDSPELRVDVVLQDRFDQGAEVGALARERFPGGVLIDLPHDDPGRVGATRRLPGGAAGKTPYSSQFCAHHRHARMSAPMQRE
jgi:hypothetical protein